MTQVKKSRRGSSSTAFLFVYFESCEMGRFGKWGTVILVYSWFATWLFLKSHPFFSTGDLPTASWGFSPTKKKNSANKFTNPLEIFGVLGYMGWVPSLWPLFSPSLGGMNIPWLDCGSPEIGATRSDEVATKTRLWRKPQRDRRRYLLR